MSPIRRGLRFLARGLLIVVSLIGLFLAIIPWITARPGALFVRGPVYAVIDGSPYVGEIVVEMSQDPLRIYHETKIAVFATDDNYDGPAKGPYGEGMFRLEESKTPQRVRLVDDQTGQVLLENAEVDWMPRPGNSVPPVSWRGNRLLLWPVGSGQQPVWRRNEAFIVSLGRHLYLNVYAVYVAKVIGVSLGIGLVVVFIARLLDRRLERIQWGRCSGCGYDLRGITSDRCPECGKPVKELPPDAGGMVE